MSASREHRTPDVVAERGPRLVRRALAVLVWLGVWQIAALVVGNKLLLAGPLQTFEALGTLVSQGEFWSKIWWSFSRIAGGFALAFAAALILAWLASRSEYIADLLFPAMTGIKSTPLACIVVLLLIWMGSRHVSMASVFLIVLPAVYFSSLEALRELDPGVLEMLEVHRVPITRQLKAFIWPSMQPFLFATSKMVCGMAWKAGVAAELIGSPLGSIGERIYQTKLLFETEQLFAWTIVVVALAALSEKAFLALLSASSELSIRSAIPHTGAATDIRSTLPGASAIGFEEASFSYPEPAVDASEAGAAGAAGAKEILSHATRSFAPGSVTCLRDASGTGKTTALKLLLGVLAPDSGRVNTTVSSAVFQESTLLPYLSAEQNVALLAGDTLSASAIRAALISVLPEETLAGPISQLSGGQKRRVELVRAMAYPSRAVVMDEPFASLDDESRAVCCRFITEQLGDRPLVVATHNEEDAELLGGEELLLFA